MDTLTNLASNQLFYLLVGLGIFGLLIWYLVADLDVVKRKVGSLLIGLVIFVCGLGLWTQGLKQGIDLQGGTALTLRVQPKDVGAAPPSQDALEQARTVLSRRLAALEFVDESTVSIILQEPDRLIVQVPGANSEQQDQVERTVTKIAKLELMVVHPENGALNREGVRNVPGYKSYTYTYKDNLGNERNETLWLSKRDKITGKAVAKARVDPARKGIVIVNMTSEGADQMRKLTSKVRLGTDRLSVVMDGKVKTAPTVNAVLSTEFVIEGLTDVGEAKAVADALNNPLDNPLLIDEKREISATLGAETIKQGLIAGAVGLGLTLILILFCYRFAGIIALVGLAVNIIVLFGAMAIFDFVFTLPGIAGVILTIGMAVDANVLIYERLREELAAGKSIGGAIRTAYEKAFSAIFDANVTTLITALILFYRASGTVKGFAITLTLGIIASMFAALIVTRVLFFYLNGTKEKDKIKKLNFTRILPESHFNFISLRKMSLSLSAILVLGSMVFIGTNGEKSLGVDFTGGSIITYTVAGADVNEDDLKAIVDTVELSKMAFVQKETNALSGEELITIRLSDKVEDLNAVTKAVGAVYPDLAHSDETVGSALGAEFLRTSIIAMIIGLIGILIYVTLRFEFSFALGALAALFHDIIICIGVVALSPSEFNLIHVGAFLTIAGYSINDTIVVFDRIRETLKLRGGNVTEIMNEAINTTLSRTLLTSVTTFAAIATLYFFGGPAMKDFSFVIMVGVIIGTYSSIFVAAPLVLVLSRKRNLREELLEAERASIAGDVEKEVGGTPDDELEAEAK